RLGALDLRGRQPLPAPHRHLAQLGHDRRPEPMGPADDLAGPPGAGQIAGEQGAELHGREAGGLSGALTLTQRRQRHVEMSDESSRLGEDDLAVAEEIDQRPRCDHADTVRRPASSAISIAAPSTSPVIPATPAAKNRVTTSALAIETATTTRPSTRSATMATTRAIDSAIGVAASRPHSASRQSASPSRCRPPVRSFHAVTVSKPARSKGNKSSVTRSVTTRIPPIPRPITGNQGAARPRASELVRAGPGRGTIVR